MDSTSPRRTEVI